jgi:predicted nucleotidyltransferase
MLNVKENVRRLISNIYECQKKILINRRFIGDLLSEGNRNAVSALQDEIKRLQEKFREFQMELNERFKYSHT